MPTHLGVARCVHLFGLLLGVCAAAFLAMDAYTDPHHDIAAPADAARAPAPEAPAHAGSGRAFVFIIDSLRYETAIDPAAMPATAGLRERGAWARTLSTRDAVTVPALRAAFTGRERFSVFGFVKNLWYGEEGFASLFSQLEAAGRRAAVYSDGSFKQFGGGPLVEYLPNDPAGRRSAEADSQAAQVAAALEMFRSGRHDLVVSHVTFADHEAHRVGIHHPDYAATFRRGDDLVRMLDEGIAPQDALVVFGDHGHDEFGRHMMGLDVPTLTVCRGPGFRPGKDFGPVPIVDLRYLLGYALKLPLPADYEAGRHPEALLPEGALPEAYALSFDLLPDLGREGGGVLRRHLPEYAGTVLALAALIAAWTALVLDPRITGRRVAVVWGALALLAAPWARPAATIAAIGAAAAALAWPGAGRPGRRVLLLCTAAFAAALLFVGWGWLLAVVRPAFHFPRFAVWIPAVFAAVIAGVPLALRLGAERAAWALFLAGGVLCYPTVYRYGAAALMGPVWMALLLYVLIEQGRARLRAGEPAFRRSDVQAAAALLLLAPFAFAQADVAQFVRWYGPLAEMVFRGEGLGGSQALAVAGAVAAKLVVFVRRGTRPMTPIAGVAAALALSAVEVMCLQPRETGAGRWPWVGAIGLSVAAWWAIGRRRGMCDRGILLRVAALSALTLVFYYSVRLPGEMYLWLDWLLAALVLSGRYLRFRGTSAHLLLLASGAWAAGWAGLAWTFHRVEWGFLYDWLDAGFVEDNSGLFIPAIVVRYLMPMIMVRIVLGEAVGGWRPYPQGASALLAGLKTLSVAAMAVGMGLHIFGDDVYLEAVQETALWGLLSAAMIFSPAPAAAAAAGAEASGRAG